jgi:hypothetical protein
MHAAEARPIEPEEEIDQGLVLEALCYSQQGSWSTFERLAAHDSDAPWFAVETGRLLSSLGHIDLVLDRRSLRPVFWSVAPTTIASLPSDASAVLCGHRSERLLARLADDVMAIGGRFAIEADPRCPPRVLVTGLEVDDLEAICDSATSALGTLVGFAEAPAVHLAQALDPLRTIADSLPAFVPPVGVGIERFDFDRNRWDAVSDIDEAGAYRFLTRPIRYGFVGRVDLSRRQPLAADNRLAKWLAAAELGVALLAYDEREEKLVCRLGAQLPGLFERAAVLCSGQPPLQRTDGTVLYRDVPEEVASGLWRALGPP